MSPRAFVPTPPAARSTTPPLLTHSPPLPLQTSSLLSPLPSLSPPPPPPPPSSSPNAAPPFPQAGRRAVKLWDVERALGGWAAAQRKFFDAGRVLDAIQAEVGAKRLARGQAGATVQRHKQ